MSRFLVVSTNQSSWQQVCVGGGGACAWDACGGQGPVASSAAAVPAAVIGKSTLKYVESRQPTKTVQMFTTAITLVVNNATPESADRFWRAIFADQTISPRQCTRSKFDLDYNVKYRRSAQPDKDPASTNSAAQRKRRSYKNKTTGYDQHTRQTSVQYREHKD